MPTRGPASKKQQGIAEPVELSSLPGHISCRETLQAAQIEVELDLNLKAAMLIVVRETLWCFSSGFPSSGDPCVLVVNLLSVDRADSRSLFVLRLQPLAPPRDDAGGPRPVTGAALFVLHRYRSTSHVLSLRHKVKTG